MAQSKERSVESILLNTFYRPYVRRLNYLYTGLDNTDDIFMLSDTEDSKFKNCEPLQTTGLIKVLNQEDLKLIKDFFFKFGIIDDTPRILYFGALLSILNKAKSDSPDMVIQTDELGVCYITIGIDSFLVSRPVDTHFTLTKLQIYVDKYTSVFFTETIPSHVVELPNSETVNKVLTLPVSCRELYDIGLLDKLCRDVNLVLQPGRDFLVIKSLLRANVPYQSGLRLWSEAGPHCINFGGFFRDADNALCIVRDNIFVFPKVKQE